MTNEGFTTLSLPQKLKDYIDSKKMIPEEPSYKVLYRLLNQPNGNGVARK